MELTDENENKKKNIRSKRTFRKDLKAHFLPFTFVCMRASYRGVSSMILLHYTQICQMDSKGLLNISQKSVLTSYDSRIKIIMIPSTYIVSNLEYQ